MQPTSVVSEEVFAVAVAHPFTSLSRVVGWGVQQGVWMELSTEPKPKP